MEFQRERQASQMAEMFYEADANPSLLLGKKVAVIGYGSQGHAHALNLADSGVEVVVGLREGSSSVVKAKDAGLTTMSVSDASAWADVVMLLAPDTAQKKIYDEEIAPNLKDGDALLFAHGFNIRYEQIQPAPGIDVAMVAPKGPGHLLRRTYAEGGGIPSLIAVHQDATTNARELALSYAHHIGSTKAGVLETTFSEETETDLFGEQTVLCGGLSALVTAGFETLVEAGYQPESAYFECLHELKLIVDLLYQDGLSGMWFSVSETAEWGGLKIGPRVISSGVKAEMKKVLDEIRSGQFADEWIAENENGQKHFNELRSAAANHPIEEVGRQLRNMMPFLANSSNIRDVSGG